jgi:hypothetical protein
MECKHEPFKCVQNKIIQGQETLIVSSHTLSNYKASIQSYQTYNLKENKFSFTSLTFGAHHISIPYWNPGSNVITTTTTARIKLVQAPQHVCQCRAQADNLITLF